MGLYLSRRPVYRTRRRVMAGVLVALVLVVIGVLVWRGAQRAASGTIVAGRDVSGQSAAQIAEGLRGLENGVVVRVSVGGQTVAASAGELGARVDAEATAAAATRAHAGLAGLVHYRFGPATTVPLVVRCDEATLRAWLDQAFASQLVSPIPPQLHYDPDRSAYVVIPGVAGSRVDDRPLVTALPGLLANPAEPAVTLPVVQFAPAVSNEAAAMAQTQLTALLATDLAVVDPGDGSVLFKPEPDEVASWLGVVPNAALGLFDITVDEGAIADYVEARVAPALRIEPVDAQVYVDARGDRVGDVGEGSPGRELADRSGLAQAWFDALTSQADGRVSASFEAVAFGTSEVPAGSPTPSATHAGHWVDVNLTTQTAVLYDGAEAVQAFTISSGAPGHRTPTGHFRVYLRVVSQRVSGDGFSYPDVRWCTWFYGNYGFHTAYWHDDFGTPVSHGCINLREADAKAVYDWLRVGDPVEIHT